MAVKMTKGSRSKPPLSQLFSRRMALVFLFLAVLFARDFVQASVLEASEESENENTFKVSPHPSAHTHTHTHTH